MQPLALDDTPRGTPLLTIDSVGAGVGEKVLVVIEGRAAGDALRRKAAPVDAAIIGIIDRRRSAMNSDELRALVRQIVRGASFASGPAPPRRRTAHESRDVRSRRIRVTTLYVTVVNTGDACVIEPDVPCDALRLLQEPRVLTSSLFRGQLCGKGGAVVEQPVLFDLPLLKPHHLEKPH